MKEFLGRFANIPNIIELDHLTVSGDVTFGRGVVLKVNNSNVPWNSQVRINVPKSSFHFSAAGYCHHNCKPWGQDWYSIRSCPWKQDCVWKPSDPGSLRMRLLKFLFYSFLCFWNWKERCAMIAKTFRKGDLFSSCHILSLKLLSIPSVFVLLCFKNLWILIFNQTFVLDEFLSCFTEIFWLFVIFKYSSCQFLPLLSLKPNIDFT